MIFIWIFADCVYLDGTVCLFYQQDKDMIDPFPLPLVIVGTKYDIFQVWLNKSFNHSTTNINKYFTWVDFTMIHPRISRHIHHQQLDEAIEQVKIL